ncbi:AAA family ATPase [Actinoplanes solisilvae]|uniref:bifunctional aminoglycoside phosphotransferase/ATP-binding protein n=1 Tax=Actinoplanes solisilvae TaxID=2486853 RepID=UPI000FD94E70|nr:AAA family ATPase [Actinoplanes solisilvae]
MVNADRATTLETHAAVLFFLGDRVYKMKKAVDLGFLDFCERADREAVCHREVELNRRLAPDVYLGVADVHGPDGKVCEHLVVMRRMPDDRRLSTMIRAGDAVDDHLRRLARLLARFHATADRGPAISAEGTRDALLGRWDATFEQLRGFRGDVLDDAAAGEIEERTHRFLAGRETLFAHRVEQGRIVDGHGDLIADDIFCLPDGPRPLDCLEFDDRLRYLDALDDAAFLAMDIEHLGAPREASEFFDHYAEFSGDPAPPPLRHHYLAYRAFVRAKVACLRHRQGDPAAASDVRSYADLTVRHLRAGTVRLIVVGGGPATGKTTLAGGIADRLGAVVLSNDRIRKEMTGLAPEMSAAAAYRHGIYTREWTDRAYRELLDRAAELLRRGETVVLDASWTAARHRQAARELATGTRSDLYELRCTADRPTVVERLAHRTATMSDADAGIADAMAATAAPWPEADVLTAGTVGETLERALAVVEPGR